MPDIRTLSIRAKIIAVTTLTAVSVAVLLSGVSLVTQLNYINDLERKIEIDSLKSAASIAYTLTPYFIDNNFTAMNNLVGFQSKRLGRAYVVVVDNDNRVMASSAGHEIGNTFKTPAAYATERVNEGLIRKYLEHGRESIEVSQPIKAGDLVLGAVRLGLDKDWLAGERKKARETIFVTIAAALVVVLTGVLLSFVVAKRISSPLLLLKEAMIKIGHERYDARLAIKSGDEIGSLADSFNRMLDELKASRDQLEKRTAETVSAMHLATIGELTSGVAHEINNPINGVINYAQILSDRLPRGSQEREIAERMIKEANRVALTVSGLLSFARSGSQERKPVEIGQIIYEALSLTKEQIWNDGIQLKIDVPDDLPRVTVNSHQLEEVFLNLLSNARYALNEKYNGEHDNKTIEITGKRIVMDKSPFLQVIFLDHGTGIPSAIVDKVTAPFFSTKPSGRGTGLGLNISRRIIRDHGGTLAIESEEGKFTRVAIALPTSQGEA